MAFSIAIVTVVCLLLTPLGYSGIANERTWYIGAPTAKAERPGIKGALRELRGIPAVALGVVYVIGAGACIGLCIAAMVL